MKTARYDHKCIFSLYIYCIGGISYNNDGTLITLSSMEIFNPRGSGSLVPQYNINLNIPRSGFVIKCI